MLIESDGPIEQITINEQWYGEPMRMLGNVYRESFWKFHHINDERVIWAFYCDGHKGSPGSGKLILEKLFSENVHLKGEECNTLTKWYRPLPLAGDIVDNSVDTGSLNGRRATFLNRTWSYTQSQVLYQNTALHSIIDAADDGTLVCELTYHAPPELFDKYLAEAQSITNSVKWRKTKDGTDWEAGVPYSIYVNGTYVPGRRQGDRRITPDEWFSGNYPPFKR